MPKPREHPRRAMAGDPFRSQGGYQYGAPRSDYTDPRLSHGQNPYGDPGSQYTDHEFPSGSYPAPDPRYRESRDTYEQNRYAAPESQDMRSGHGYGFSESRHRQRERTHRTDSHHRPEPQPTQPDTQPYRMELAVYPNTKTLTDEYNKWKAGERNLLEKQASEIPQFSKNVIQMLKDSDDRYYEVEKQLFKAFNSTPTFSSSNLECILKLYNLFLTKYPTSTSLSFLLASIFSEGFEAANMDFLVYLSCADKPEHWLTSSGPFKIDLLKPGRQPKQEEPGEFLLDDLDPNTVLMEKVWRSLWKNIDFALPVLEELCCEETYHKENPKDHVNPNRPCVNINQRLVDLIGTFHHLIQHPDPASVFGPVTIKTALKYAGTSSDDLKGEGLRRYCDKKTKKNLGLTKRRYACTCSSTHKLLTWHGAEDA
ncbi:hypothetical protein FQN51_009025 [Onygenales sp. PD_10]|nr:hypothetical protein FQN51_009025 [Onygenales sp. PD_10]